MSPSPRELLQRLFVYIEEQLKNIDPRGFQITKSGTPRLFPKDLANLPGVSFDIQESGDHIWLKVDRLEEIAPPAVGTTSYADCISFDTTPSGNPPRLNEAVVQSLLKGAAETMQGEELITFETQLRLGAETAVATYTSLWLEWAAAEKPRRKSISLYSDIFALRHQLHAEQTANPVEFVWGLGIAAWKLNFEGKDFDFQYPLLTQPLEIALNEDSMALEIRARSTEPNCEMDPFVSSGVIGAAQCEKAMLEHLARNREIPPTPFTPSSYADILKLAARNLDSRGSYAEVLAQGQEPPTAGEHLIVSDAWVLFTRPKSNNFLIADLKKIRNKLEAGCDIPAGPLALVTPPSDEAISYHTVNFRGLSSRGSDGRGMPKELYFPLPYNQEQVTIVQRLEHAAGVAVQGPPGTGKTHTIANIICHYLASGLRVLVTSRGEPALEVLQSKIPEDVDLQAELTHFYG